MYEFGKTLGEGGFATTKSAVHRVSGVEFAIKIMEKDSLSGTELENVRTELQTLQKVDHPNICNIYEVFEDS